MAGSRRHRDRGRGGARVATVGEADASPRGSDGDELLQRATELVGHLAELSHSNSADSLLEIAAAGVSKASALTRVCAERGIASDEVVAFGDMPNDLPMLRWAGHAVAVANAHADLLAAADEVTTSNDD